MEEDGGGRGDGREVFNGVLLVITKHEKANTEANDLDSIVVTVRGNI